MGSRVIPVRLDRETIEFIDMLVKMGIFSSRSEALRELVKIGIENLKGIKAVMEGVEKLIELEKREGDIPIKLPGALKQLLEERERF